MGYADCKRWQGESGGWCHWTSSLVWPTKRAEEGWRGLWSSTVVTNCGACRVVCEQMSEPSLFSIEFDDEIKYLYQWLLWISFVLFIVIIININKEIDINVDLSANSEHLLYRLVLSQSVYRKTIGLKSTEVTIVWLFEVNIESIESH